MTHKGQVVLLFDGVCNSCNFIVDFILKRDLARVFRFAALQSESGQSLLKAHRLSTQALDTLVLIEDDRIHVRSNAAFRIFRLLGRPWHVLCVFSILPKFITDTIYNIYAKNRYRLFGKRNRCRILSREEQALFLEPQ